MISTLRLGAPAVLAALVLAGLTACAPAVALVPAANATNPACAEVIVRLPHSVASKTIRETNAQATGAWGDPAAILLRCGVTPPGPTSDRCYTVNGVDWLINDTRKPVYVFTTYGRTPAVQVVVDSNLTNGQGTIALDELANAVGSIKQSTTHRCEDVLGNSSPGTAPSPSPAPSATPTPKP
ncbi:MAG: DUF3515 family protein [Lacisediminihabitans sp.]